MSSWNSEIDDYIINFINYNMKGHRFPGFSGKRICNSSEAYAELAKIIQNKFGVIKKITSVKARWKTLQDTYTRYIKACQQDPSTKRTPLQEFVYLKFKIYETGNTQEEAPEVAVANSENIGNDVPLPVDDLTSALENPHSYQDPHSRLTPSPSSNVNISTVPIEDTHIHQETTANEQMSIDNVLNIQLGYQNKSTNGMICSTLPSGSGEKTSGKKKVSGHIDAVLSTKLPDIEEQNLQEDVDHTEAMLAFTEFQKLGALKKVQCFLEIQKLMMNRNK